MVRVRWRDDHDQRDACIRLLLIHHHGCRCNGLQPSRFRLFQSDQVRPRPKHSNEQSLQLQIGTTSSQIAESLFPRRPAQGLPSSAVSSRTESSWVLTPVRLKATSLLTRIAKRLVTNHSILVSTITSSRFITSQSLSDAVVLVQLQIPSSRRQ